MTDKGFELEFGETTERTDTTEIKIWGNLFGIKSEVIVNPATTEEALDSITFLTNECIDITSYETDFRKYNEFREDFIEYN